MSKKTKEFCVKCGTKVEGRLEEIPCCGGEFDCIDGYYTSFKCPECNYEWEQDDTQDYKNTPHQKLSGKFTTYSNTGLAYFALRAELYFDKIVEVKTND